MRQFKRFIKIMARAYIGGIVGMWLMIFTMSFFEPDWYVVWQAVSGIILTPFTPLGLPFFVGACLALTFMKKGKSDDKVIRR